MIEKIVSSSAIANATNALDRSLNQMPSLGAALIKYVGGNKAFRLTADIYALDIPLKEIRGFKEPEPIAGFFERFPETMMGVIDELAANNKITTRAYLSSICSGRGFNPDDIEDCYRLIDGLYFSGKNDEADDYTLHMLDKMVYAITLEVLSVIISNYNSTSRFVALNPP